MNRVYFVSLAAVIVSLGSSVAAVDTKRHRLYLRQGEDGFNVDESWIRELEDQDTDDDIPVFTNKGRQVVRLILPKHLKTKDDRTEERVRVDYEAMSDRVNAIYKEKLRRLRRDFAVKKDEADDKHNPSETDFKKEGSKANASDEFLVRLKRNIRRRRKINRLKRKRKLRKRYMKKDKAHRLHRPKPRSHRKKRRAYSEVNMKNEQTVPARNKTESIRPTTAAPNDLIAEENDSNVMDHIATTGKTRTVTYTKKVGETVSMSLESNTNIPRGTSRIAAVSLPTSETSVTLNERTITPTEKDVISTQTYKTTPGITEEDVTSRNNIEYTPSLSTYSSSVTLETVTPSMNSSDSTTREPVMTTTTSSEITTHLQRTAEPTGSTRETGTTMDLAENATVGQNSTIEVTPSSNNSTNSSGEANVAGHGGHLSKKHSLHPSRENSAIKPPPIPPKKVKRIAVIDLLVIVDWRLFQVELRKYRKNELLAIIALKKYYSLVIKMTDMRFSAIEDEDFIFRVKTSGIYICRDWRESIWAEYNKKRYRDGYAIDPYSGISDLRDWLMKKGRKLGKFDHVMAFTYYRLVRSNGVVNIGIAFTKSMCNTKHAYSLSLVEEQGGFSSVGTAAHELGHSLGAAHDTTRAGCEAENNFIMTPRLHLAVDLQKNLFMFSPCSIRSMRRFLWSSKSSCLFDSKPPTYRDDKWPGQVMGGDTQCRYVYGPRSGLCWTKNLRDQMCARLWCRLPRNPVQCAASGQMLAVFGSTCAHHKVCMEGECQYHPNAPPDKRCLFGDWEPDFCNRRVKLAPQYFCLMKKLREKCCETCKPYPRFHSRLYS